MLPTLRVEDKGKRSWEGASGGQFITIPERHRRRRSHVMHLAPISSLSDKHYNSRPQDRDGPPEELKGPRPKVLAASNSG